MSHTTTDETAAYVQRLDDYLRASGVVYACMTPGVPMPTVPLAAAAIGAEEAQILKTLLFEGTDGNVALVIANGSAPIDLKKLSDVSSLENPRLAKPRRVLELTGFPAGGVPPVGHATPLRTFIDRGVTELDIAYGGGGCEDALIQLNPVDIVRLTNAQVVSITANPHG